MKRFIKAGLGALVAVGLIVGLSACSEDRALSVPQSFCGFVQGNGGLDNNQNVNSADVKEVLYQGQTAKYKSDQSTGYVFPCVQRNYIIAPEGQSADSNVPLHGLTSDKVPVVAWVSTYWQPNQAPEPIRQFIGFAQGKYGAAAQNASAFTGTETNSNASTPGWNKMLSENMWPTLQRVFERAVATISNDVWQKQDAVQREDIAVAMSDAFGAEFQKVTGSTMDLICGAGSTGTGDTFNCKQILIYVDGVFAQDGTQQSAASTAAANEAQRKLDQSQLQADVDLTNTKYGPLAAAYRACRDLNAQQAGSCKFITGPGGAQVPVP